MFDDYDYQLKNDCYADKARLESQIESLTAQLDEARKALEKIQAHQESLCTGNFEAYKLTGAWCIAAQALSTIRDSLQSKP